jgi:hypothetical protein
VIGASMLLELLGKFALCRIRLDGGPISSLAAGTGHTGARLVHPVKRTSWSADGAAEMGRYCCKSRKMKRDEKRHETHCDEKVLIKAIAARLRRPLVE